MKVLFIGNSHTFVNDVPHTAEVLAERCSIDMTCQRLARGGVSLEWHAKQPETRVCIAGGGFDKVVLQDVAHDFRGIEPLRRGAEAINGMLQEQHITPYLYLTWASRRKPEVQQEMTDAYTTVAVELGAVLCPVGIVWQRVRNESEIDLFCEDGEHASLYGSYLSACVLFCTLSGYHDLLPDAKGSFYERYGADTAICNILHRYVYDALYL